MPALAFAALTGAVVAGLGSPIVLEVAGERGVSIEAAQWTLTITLLVGVVGTPVVSRLGDGHRTRPILVASLLVVGAGSVCAALVPTFPGLLAGRAMQGLGYAMVPLTVRHRAPASARAAAEPDPRRALHQRRGRCRAWATR